MINISYRRGANEHIDKYNKNTKESFIRNHQIQKHSNSEPNFKVKVLKSFKVAATLLFCAHNK